MKKIILAFTAIATLAVPAVSMANVSVDANGTGSVGKGDVQTALGYANDAAFQAAHPETATFTIDNGRSEVSVDVLCQKMDGTTRVLTVSKGYVAFNEVGIKSAPKMSNGKVTGYALTGSVTEVGNHLNSVNPTGACDAGENWAGYADTTPNGKWRWTPVQGSGILQVTLNSKTVALPNTPVL